MAKKKKDDDVVVAKPRRGRPPVWGPDKKFNKTIRLSEDQENTIYASFPTLQAYIEHTYKKFLNEKKRKKTA
jgi:hypothetical protein|tara:strand:+ start:2914 stop:3129 length:216 start_codon:yes stop_codon:yes gene_type:complete